MLTLFCLGNPTLKQKFNRHNAGLLLGEFLIEKMDLGIKKFKNYKLSNSFFIRWYSVPNSLIRNIHE